MKIDLPNSLSGVYFEHSNRIYQVVNQLSIPNASLFAKMKQILKKGFKAPYDSFPMEYDGWGDRVAFRNKVAEINGGRYNSLFSI